MSVIVEIFLLFEKIIDLFNFQFFFNQSAPFQRLKETFCFPFTCLTTRTYQRTNSKLFYFKGKRGCVKYTESTQYDSAVAISFFRPSPDRT